MPDKNPFEQFRFEIDPTAVQKSLESLRDHVSGIVSAASESLDNSRHMKMRLTYKGKQIGPDVPLPLILAGEGVVFMLLSPLAAVVLNLGASAVLDVEILHDADEHLTAGAEAYRRGELDEAEAAFQQALEVRPEDPSALYQLGVLHRVRGQGEEALAFWRRAAMGPEDHPDVIAAAEAIDRASGKRRL